MHYKEIRVEGFEIHKLLSQCLKENIHLKNIRILKDHEFTAIIDGQHWQRFCKIAKNRYSIYVIKEKGIKPFGLRLISNRWAVLGGLLFLILIFLQTTFISEIRIYGYERLTEKEILDSLEEAGLYAGCSRYVNLDRIKIEMYRNLDNINWIGIALKGGLAEVTIAEGTKPPNLVTDDRPCHIVAKKEGYIEKTIAREGKEVVEKGDFVNVGEILISGIIEIEDKTYTRDSENPAFRYVHSDGDVYAKTVHRFISYQEVLEKEKKLTGKTMPSLRIKLGNRIFNTSDFFTTYEASVYNEKEILNTIWPYPIEIAFGKVSEIEILTRERTRKEIEDFGNLQARELIKNNFSDSSQIINKSLNFSPEENIIKVTILLEVLEEIGQKEPFIPEIIDETEHEAGENTEI